MGIGKKLDVLTGLGNGFDTENCPDNPLIIGGGMGVAPLLPLCKELSLSGKAPKVILGFHSAEEIILLEEYSSYCNDVTVTTSDGTAGMKGRVTDAMDELHNCSYIFCCGSEGMMKSVFEKAKCPGQYSFEERMGCGFGSCMGCSRKTKNGYKRVCKEGPVFDSEEIIW
jgi:dihydroorotate dehydrogenase electron transfer subunit